jgi:hypothetical protein
MLMLAAAGYASPAQSQAQPIVTFDPPGSVFTSVGGISPEGERFKVCVLAEQSEVSYAKLALELGMKENAVRVAAHRLRQRYGKLLRPEVAQTVSTPDEVNEELRYLVSVVRDGMSKSSNSRRRSCSNGIAPYIHG